MEVVIGFSMLKKQRRKHRRGQDMSKKTEHAEVQKRNMPKKQRKEKEDRSRKKRKGAKIARCLVKHYQG